MTPVFPPYLQMSSLQRGHWPELECSTPLPSLSGALFATPQHLIVLPFNHNYVLGLFFSLPPLSPSLNPSIPLSVPQGTWRSENNLGSLLLTLCRVPLLFATVYVKLAGLWVPAVGWGGVFCLYLPSSRLTIGALDYRHMLPYLALHGFWGSGFKSSYLHGSFFTLRITSISLRFSCFKFQRNSILLPWMFDFNGERY